MQEATDWDLWSAGLIDGPEPVGSRNPAELAALRAGQERNFARACEAANAHYRRWHGPPTEQHRTAHHYAAGHNLLNVSASDQIEKAPEAPRIVIDNGPFK